MSEKSDKVVSEEGHKGREAEITTRLNAHFMHCAGNADGFRSNFASYVIGRNSRANFVAL
jgi:hypothetical protein